MTMKGGALSRFKVLDLTRVRAGPTCVRQFADFGAQVVKVEAPGAGDGGMGGPRLGSDFQNLHRNKRCITLDLKHPAGKEALMRLAAGADVLVENFRPDVKDRLGLGYAAMRALNPRLVYASISGFGEDGPYRMRPGFDQIAQGLGGLMSVTGAPGGGPMRVGIPVADLTAGLFAAQGIMAALLEREASGEGQWVQVSLLASQIAMMDFQAARYLMEGEVPGQAGNNHPTSIPTGVFATSDGYVNIAASGNAIWVRLARALGLDALVDDTRFDTGAARLLHRDELNGLIEAVTRTRRSADWVEALAAAEVPCGPVYAMDQVFADPQVRHLGMAPTVRHPDLGEVALVGQAIKLSRTPAELRTATAGLGEHTDEVLQELGYSAQEVAAMRAEGAV
jgi:crotonobetainyl-CoA:carnitine CoA-transferase CaiB-like acyl-CoA transferase